MTPDCVVEEESLEKSKTLFSFMLYQSDFYCFFVINVYWINLRCNLVLPMKSFHGYAIKVSLKLRPSHWDTSHIYANWLFVLMLISALCLSAHHTLCESEQLVSLWLREEKAHVIVFVLKIMIMQKKISSHGMKSCLHHPSCDLVLLMSLMPLLSSSASSICPILSLGCILYAVITHAMPLRKCFCCNIWNMGVHSVRVISSVISSLSRD